MIKKLNTGSLPKYDEPSEPYLDWCAHLFTAKRTQYILVTESISLFSLVMYGRGLTGFDVYYRTFQLHLEDYLIRSGNQFIYQRIIENHEGKTILAKSNKRVVLGSMNDMIHILKALPQSENMDLTDLSDVVNNLPMGALKYMKPRKAFVSMKL